MTDQHQSLARLYADTIRPQLEAEGLPARRAVRAFWWTLWPSLAATAWIAWTERSAWWMLLPVVLVFTCGVIAHQRLQAFTRSFSQRVVAPVVHGRWPDARHDPDGQLSRATITGAGLYSEAQIHALRDLVRLDVAGLPVAICGGQLLERRRADGNARRDVPVFTGTLMQAGFTGARLTMPVVVATHDADRRPRPLSALAAPKVTLGHPDADAVLDVWAATDAEARAVVSPDIAARLVALSKAGLRFRLVVDGDGMVAAIDGQPLWLGVTALAGLPGPDRVIEEITRVQAAVALAGAFAQSRRFTARPLVDFEGVVSNVVADAPLGDIRGTPEWTVLHDEVRRHGIDVEARGDQLVLRFPVRRGLWVRLAVGAFWVWVAAEIAGMARGWPTSGSTLRGWLNGIDAMMLEPLRLAEHLASWHPWSTLAVGTTVLFPLHAVLRGSARVVEVGASAVTVRSGWMGVRREHAVGPDDEVALDARVRIRIGPPNLPALFIDTELSREAAVAVARLVAAFLRRPASVR